MATTNILPSVHATGLWSLTDPFAHYLTRDVQYTCIAIRRLEELRLQGIDPFRTYYQPHSLSEEKYKEDYSNNVSIITVKNTAGDLKSFPSSYLLSFPSSEGVTYVNMGLGISLGALPTNKALDDLTLKLREVIHDTLGLTPEIKLIQLSDVTMLSQETHENMESNRKAKIKESNTSLSQVVQLQERVKAQDALIKELEVYIARLP